MQNFLKEMGWKESLKFDKKYKKQDIPDPLKYIYSHLLGKLKKHFEELIEDILLENEGHISFPIGTKMLENYLTGYKINYLSFESDIKGFEGYWKFDEFNNDTINIYYNSLSPEVKQKSTKTHETFHVIQFLDMHLRSFFDTLMYDSRLSGELVEKLMERSVDKATDMYLMPEKYFLNKVKELKYANNKIAISKLSNIMKVSKKAIYCRLKECKQI